MVLKRMARPLEAASAPVNACGYMNNAIAEPTASVMYGPTCGGFSVRPAARLGFAATFASNALPAASKIAPKPPSS